MAYKKALALAARPTIVAEQSKMLSQNVSTRVSLNLNFTPTLKIWQSLIHTLLIPAPYTENDSLTLMLACEKAETASRQAGFWSSILEADMRRWLLDCLRAYQSAFLFSRVTPTRLTLVSKKFFNIHLHQPPKNLPVGSLPSYLGVLPWYRQEAVLVPCLGILIFCLIVTQMTLLRTFTI